MNVTSIMPSVTVSVVIPVYTGEKSLPLLIQELAVYAEKCNSPGGVVYAIKEVLLVHDCGPDRSDLVLEKLVTQYPFVKPIWLSRNYGQHAATLAGMATASGVWVLTMDEDGQHNPADIGKMLDIALNHDYQIVYAEPINSPPHGIFRNFCSRAIKKIIFKSLGKKKQVRDI